MTSTTLTENGGRRMRLTRGNPVKEGIAIVLFSCLMMLIFFPVQGGSYRHHSQCLSNMKQVGIGFLLYLEENDGQFPTDDPSKRPIKGVPPMPADVNAIRPFEPFWMTAIQPFVKTEGLFRCNEDKSEYPKDPQNVNTVYEYRSSYALNGWTEYQLKLSDVTSPAEWVFIGDRNNVSQRPDGSWSFYFWQWQGTDPQIWPPTASPDPTPKAAKDIDLTRHNGGSTWLYGDSHVNVKKFPQLWKPGKENAFWPTRD